jgi:hypothetical protein
MKHAIRSASRSDLSFLRDLARKYTPELGFLSNEAMERYVDLGGVRLILLNGQPAGYTLGRVAVPTMPGMSAIYQTCVQMDARRHSAGRLLVADQIRRARIAQRGAIQLWCAHDIEAVEFWAAVGARPIAIREGGVQRKRVHLLWRIRTNPGTLLDAPAAVRRRRGAGLPVPLPRSMTTAEVIDRCKTNQLRELLKNSCTAATEAPSPANGSSQLSLFGC